MLALSSMSSSSELQFRSEILTLLFNVINLCNELFFNRYGDCCLTHTFTDMYGYSCVSTNRKTKTHYLIK